MEPSICKEGGVDPQSLSWGSTSPESSLLRPVFTYHPPTPQRSQAQASLAGLGAPKVHLTNRLASCTSSLKSPVVQEWISACN